MTTFMMMPPQDDQKRDWARRLAADVPGFRVLTPVTEDEVRRDPPEVEAAFGWVPPDLLPLATRLRWLQNPDAGPRPDYFYQALVDHPVVIANPRGIYFDHISQHIMMFLLALGQGLPFYMAAQRERRWDPDARPRPALDLASATALIHGVGGIGHETARLCVAFGMTVLGVDQRWEFEAPVAERLGPDDLDRVLPRADVIITTTPHTPQTEGLWNARRFALMKPTAYFINIGRGRTTRLDDLADAIERGVIAGCGLDVFEVEPLPADHRLWALPNVLITPHIAVKDAANLPERRYQVLVDNARRFAADQPLRNVVDKAAWF